MKEDELRTHATCLDREKQIGRDRHLCPNHLAEHRDAAPELF